MPFTILLYGATGFSGRLIAREAASRGMGAAAPSGNYRMLLAGRDREGLARVARDHDMPCRVFSLDDPFEIVRQLQDVDVVLNAAGPFAWTADRLAKAALVAGCHYVDINGEVDVYLKLDDLEPRATRRGRVLVCGAGHSAAASDLLLDAALRELDGATRGGDRELGAVRIALSRVKAVSRGSAQSAWRTLREQVTIARARPRRDPEAGGTGRLVLWHEPVGKRERPFDFGVEKPSRDSRSPHLDIAAAANLVDTLTARRTLARRNYWAHNVESYMQVGALARIGYPLGALLAPLTALPVASAIMNAQLQLLPEGPSDQELEERHSLVLEIENRFRSKLIDWRWETPNVYVFTAQLAVEVARKVAERTTGGWLTPAEVIGPVSIDSDVPVVVSPEVVRPASHPQAEPAVQTPSSRATAALFDGCKLERRGA